ncbi:CopM family metallochaperone [Microvirga sp. G4-2]|uniref:CopM family metallochaperone n=1 Tax=Microvirga sp. G4-2 TaxID=3434467 RepID=UPI004044FD70
MKSSILALVFVAGLSAPALAQQATPSDADHNAHHPEQAQAQTTAPAGSPQTPMGATPSTQDGSAGPNGQRPSGMIPGMSGGMMQEGMTNQVGSRPGGMMSGIGQNMMMNCPMMQSGMAGMMGRQSGSMQMGGPRGDQSVASLAMNAVNERMHREMAMEYTGNADADFATNMIAHHQGAIDMAKIAVAFGKDPKIRELAQNVISAQEDEITMLKSWLATSAKQ